MISVRYRNREVDQTFSVSKERISINYISRKQSTSGKADPSPPDVTTPWQENKAKTFILYRQVTHLKSTRGKVVRPPNVSLIRMAPLDSIYPCSTKWHRYASRALTMLFEKCLVMFETWPTSLHIASTFQTIGR